MTRLFVVRSFAVALVVAFTGSLAVAGGHNQGREPAIAKDQVLTAEIDAFLNEYEEQWDLQDPSKLAELWDQDDDQPYYLAEEQAEWRIGWKQVMGYFAPGGPSTTESIRMRFDGTQARWLADDLAFAKFWIRFDTSMQFLPAPIGTDARASAIFRKTDDGWRLLSWAESPMSPIIYIENLYKEYGKEGEASPIPYIQELYQRRTRPDFGEYMETHSKEAMAE